MSYLKFWPDFGTSFDSQSKTFWFLKSKLSIFRFMPNFQFSSFLKFLNTPFGPFCGTGTGTGLIWDWDCWTIIISYNYIFIDNVIWPKTCRFTRESSIYVLLNFLQRLHKFYCVVVLNRWHFQLVNFNHSLERCAQKFQERTALLNQQRPKRCPIWNIVNWDIIIDQST